MSDPHPCGPFRVRVPVPAEPAVVRVPAPTMPAIVQRVDVGPMGPAGRDGIDGSALTLIAGLDLSGHRVVRAGADGTAIYASALVPGDAAAALGLTLGAAEAGAPVAVSAVGDLVEPSWAWTPGLPVWLGSAGTLVQTPDARGDFRSIGVAITPTRLAIALGSPLIRT